MCPSSTERHRTTRSLKFFAGGEAPGGKCKITAENEIVVVRCLREDLTFRRPPVHMAEKFFPWSEPRGNVKAYEPHDPGWLQNVWKRKVRLRCVGVCVCEGCLREYKS